MTSVERELKKLTERLRHELRPPLIPHVKLERRVRWHRARALMILTCWVTVATVASISGLRLLEVSSPAPSVRPEAIDTLVEAAAATYKAKTARFTLVIRTSLGGIQSHRALRFMLNGAIDLTAGKAHLKLAGRRFAALPRSDLEIVQDASTLYVKGPGLIDKPWTAVDIAQGGDVFFGAGFLRHLLGGGRNDPFDMIGYLRRATGKAELIDREPLRGVITTHYRALINPRSLSQPEKTRSATPVADPITLDVWIDDAKRIRKLELAFDLPQGSLADDGVSSTGVVATLELFALGRPVEIRIPPPRQVRQLENLRGSP
jgi:hypothetical protein